MGLMDFLTDPLGFERGERARMRQQEQWQLANKALKDAVAAIESGNSEAAAASALVGLLSLQLSRT
jgi:hypothetical protein